MNRRNFLKLCGLAAHGLALGFGTTGYATAPKNINWSEVPDKEFSLDKFDDWFVAHKLYNGINPNLNITQRGHNPTTEANIMSSYLATPGIDYNSGVLCAAAGGQVARISDIDKLGTGRRGGYTVSISHPIAGPNMMDWVITTRYAHVYKPKLEVGDMVHSNHGIDPLRDQVGDHRPRPLERLSHVFLPVSPTKLPDNREKVSKDREKVPNLSISPGKMRSSAHGQPVCFSLT